MICRCKWWRSFTSLAPRRGWRWTCCTAVVNWRVWTSTLQKRALPTCIVSAPVPKYSFLSLWQFWYIEFALTCASVGVSCSFRFTTHSAGPHHCFRHQHSPQPPWLCEEDDISRPRRFYMVSKVELNWLYFITWIWLIWSDWVRLHQCQLDHL